MRRRRAAAWQEPPRWPHPRPRWASPWPGAPQFHLRRTRSTVEDARRLVRAAPADGALIVADFQTHGRGRTVQRRWVSAPRRNLLFNLLLSAATVGADAHRLPLLTGLAVARGVREVSGLPCRVKWPNDVVVRGCKIAGCLCEGLRGWYSIGVGVTCNQRRGLPRTASGELPASSVALQSGRRVPRRALLEAILAELHRLLAETDWAAAVDRLLFARGSWVRLEAAGQGAPRCARVVGIAPGGGLCVQGADGEPYVCHVGSLRAGAGRSAAGS